MPILAALDECWSTLRKISIYADLGLEDPSMQYQALLAINECCENLMETIDGIMPGLLE